MLKGDSTNWWWLPDVWALQWPAPMSITNEYGLYLLKVTHGPDFTRRHVFSPRKKICCLQHQNNDWWNNGVSLLAASFNSSPALKICMCNYTQKQSILKWFSCSFQFASKVQILLHLISSYLCRCKLPGFKECTLSVFYVYAMMYTLLFRESILHVLLLFFKTHCLAGVHCHDFAVLLFDFVCVGYLALHITCGICIS